MGFEDTKPGLKTDPLPEALAPGAPPETPPPAVAAKADDLEEIKKAVEDAASVSGGLWLSYLFVLVYVAIAAGAVTHADLLLERAVKLPFLNVELPLLAFFALAPFVVLITHIYALMHFRMLGNKARQFHRVLRDTFPGEGDNEVIRGNKRRLLPSNIFVQILAGPPELRAGFFGFMLKAIAVITLIVVPVLVLLLLQIQFLPFHDRWITWAQRGALFFDVLLLWPLRPPILTDLSVESSGRARVFVRVLRGFGLTLAGVISIAAIVFSIALVTIPGEGQETALAALDRPRWQITYVEDGKEKTKLGSTHDLLFVGDVDETTRRRKSLFSNTLVLPGFNLFEALKIDDPKRLAWREHLFDFRGRHLEQAVLYSADLTKADLTGAQLQGASLQRAQLQGASLDEAKLQDADLSMAQLQGASLVVAKLQGAQLVGAQLQGALLYRAQLQGARLVGAQLQGASLDFALLQGSSLNAQLQGARLVGAQLQGASLNGAQLQGARLDMAQLQGASFYSVQLQGASLAQAEVNATDFSHGVLWRTDWRDLAKLGEVLLKDATWKRVFLADNPDNPPLLWDAKAYEVLRKSMNAIPKGKSRDVALQRIERLDCGNTAKFLASCDPAAEPPPQVSDWQKKLEAASVDGEAFAKALAEELRSLVCAIDPNAIHILRGTIKSERLAATGHEATTLVDVIMGKDKSKDCPVSAALTSEDKAKLLQIKQDAEEKFPPPPASKKDK